MQSPIPRSGLARQCLPKSSAQSSTLCFPTRRIPRLASLTSPKNPTLRVKLPFYDGEWKGVEIYDSNHTALFPNSEGKTPKDLITKGSDAALIITCGGLWFAGGSFGVTWRLVQAVLKPKPTLSGKCHIVLDDDEQRRITAPTPAKASAAQQHHDDDHVPSVSASQEVDVEDSDEEDDSPAQRVASVPPPAAAAVAPKNDCCQEEVSCMLA